MSCNQSGCSSPTSIEGTHPRLAEKFGDRGLFVGNEDLVEGNRPEPGCRYGLPTRLGNPDRFCFPALAGGRY